MGTDVHMIGEYYDKYDKKYYPFMIPPAFTGRYYSFFAAIGNVRNGFGFAGCYRHEPIIPISDNRGIPDDASEFTKSLFHGDDIEDDLMGITWLGDHSFSYVTLKEMKEYDWPVVIKGGVMPYQQWCDWDKQSEPLSYSGGVSGQNIITIDESEVNNITFQDGKKYYVQFKFQDNLVDPDFIKSFIGFLDLYKRRCIEDSDIRIVFGFDS